MAAQQVLDEQLVAACEAGNLAQARGLLDAGADVNCELQTMFHYASGVSGMTPLLAACDHGNVELVRMLLERGADPDQFVGETQDEGISDCKMVATDRRLDARHFGRFHLPVLALLDETARRS